MADPQGKHAPEQGKAPVQAAARNAGPAVELSFTLQVGDAEPKAFTLKGTEGRITIGRKPTSDFVLEARSVSFDHCEIFLQRKGRDPILSVRDVSKNMTGVRSARASYNNDAWVELRKGEIHVLQHLSELRVPYQERSKPDQVQTASRIRVTFVLPDAYSERDGSGRWQYIEKLGEGGLAVVYRAKDITGPLQHVGSVAVKISKFSNLEEISPQNRHIYALHREAQWSLQRLHAKSDHRYCAAGAALFASYLEDHTGFEAHSSGDFDTDRRYFESPDFKWDQKRFSPALTRRPYVVMELCRGKLLQAAMDGQPALTHVEKLSIVQQCAEAFAYMEMHGVIHRDFRGCNLFLQDRGPLCKLKVIDLGFMISLEPKQLQATNSNSAVRCAWQGDPSKKLRFDWAPPEVQPKGSCNFGNPGCSFDAFSLGVLILKLLRGRQWAQEQLGKKCSGLLDAQSDMHAIGLPIKLVARLLDFQEPAKRPRPQTLVAALVKNSPLALKRKQAPAVVAKMPRLAAADTLEPKCKSKAKSSERASKVVPEEPAQTCEQQAHEVSSNCSPGASADDTLESPSRSAPEKVKDSDVMHMDIGDRAENVQQSNTAGAGQVSVNDSAWTPLRSSGGDENEQRSQAKSDHALVLYDPANLKPLVKEEHRSQREADAHGPEVRANADETVLASSLDPPVKVNAQTPTDALNQIQATWQRKEASRAKTDSSTSSETESSASSSAQAEGSTKEDAEDNSKQMPPTAGSRSRSQRGRDRRRSRRRRQLSNGRRQRRNDRRASMVPADFAAMQCPPWGSWQDPSAHAAAMAWCAQAHAAASYPWMGNYWQNVASSGATQPWMADTTRLEKSVAPSSSTSANSRSKLPPPPAPPQRERANTQQDGIEESKLATAAIEDIKPRAGSTAAAAHAVARCKASTKALQRASNGEKHDPMDSSCVAAMTAAKAVAFARPKASRVPPPPPPPRRESANSQDRCRREKSPDSEGEARARNGDASENRDSVFSRDRRANSESGRHRRGDRRREWSPGRRRGRRRRRCRSMRNDSRDSRDSRGRELRLRSRKVGRFRARWHDQTR